MQMLKKIKKKPMQMLKGATKAPNKLVVKVDLGRSRAAFGKDLGGFGSPSWGQVEPSWPILASSGCSWAPFGRTLVPTSCQNGPQGTPWRLQEWIFGRFLVDFIADFAHIYRQISRYERHWKSMMILIHTRISHEGARHIKSCKVALLIRLSLVAGRWACLLPFTPSHMCKDGRRYVRSTGNF